MGQLTESEDSILSQKLVSVEYRSGGTGQIHQFTVEVGGQGAGPIGMIAHGGVAVPAGQLDPVSGDR